MLKTRLLTALISLPIIIFFTWKGGIFFAGLVIAIILLSIFEFYTLFKINLFRTLGIIAIVFGTVLGLIGRMETEAIYNACLTITILTAISLQLIDKKPGEALSGGSLAIFGLIYTCWLFSHFIILRQLPRGISYVFSILTITWLGNTAAYVVGSKYGRKKLIPRITPNKTVEGALAEVITAVVISILCRWGFNNGLSVRHSFFLGLIIGVFSIMGDLTESMIKRAAKVKDVSRLIPGHGGVLDRIDSLLFTAPAYYYYLQIFVLEKVFEKGTATFF
jgi:phosphatidate cytidylyltransferase